MKTNAMAKRGLAAARRAGPVFGGTSVAAGVAALGAACALAACSTPSQQGGAHPEASQPSSAARGVPAFIDPSFDVSGVVRRARAAFRPAAGGFVSGASNLAVQYDADHGLAISPAHYLQPPAGTATPSAALRAQSALPPARALRPSALAARHNAYRRTGTPAQFATASVRVGSLTVSAPASETRVGPGGELEITRGAAVEVVRTETDAVEQSWRFDSRPAGEGDLEVRVAVSGEEFAGQTAAGLHFVDRATGVGLRYGEATWVDAAGHRSQVASRWENGAIVLTVPGDVVRASAYPAVLDPTVGAEFGIDNAASTAGRTEEAPAIAFDGTNYLVVWEDDRNKLGGNETTWDLYGSLVTRAGGVLNTAGFALGTSSTKSYYSPAVAFDGTNFLVVWVDDDQAAVTDIIFGSIVYTNGNVAGRINIGTEPVAEQFSISPAVAANPAGGFLVAWQDGDANWNVRGAAVTTNGAPGAIFDIDVTNSNAIRPSVDFDGTNYLVAYSDDDGGYPRYVRGRRFSTAGAAVDASSVLLTPWMPSASTPAAFGPSVAWNGSNHLVVWQQGDIGAADVYGRRFDSALTAVDTAGVAITTASGNQTDVRVGRYNNDWLVVWADDSAGSTNHNIAGAVFAAATGTSGAAFAIASGAGDEQYPALTDTANQDTLVVFQNGNYTGARTNAVRVSEAPTITTDRSSYTTTDSVVFSWTNFPGNNTDWIGIALQGSADNQFDYQFYLNGRISGSQTLSNLQPGTYVARGYYNWSAGGYTVQATSAPFTVSGTSTVTVSTDATSYPNGGPIVVSWTNTPGNNSDWIGLATVGSPSNTFTQMFYTNGVQSGSHTVDSLPSGTYEARVYFNYPSGGYTIRATSPQFTVTRPSTAVTLTSDRSGYNQGDTVTVSWTNLPGYSNDAIFIAPYGSADNVVDVGFYTNGVANGSRQVTGLAGGTYEIRAAYGSQPGVIQARSASTFTVTPTVPLVLSTDSTSYTAGQTVTVSWSGMPTNQHDWLSVALVGSPDNAVVTNFYTNGLSSGTHGVTGLGAGTYEIRAYYNYPYGGYFVRGRSGSFTVQ